MPVVILPADSDEKRRQGDASAFGTGGRLPIFQALLDTGAQLTFISESVADHVGLEPIGAVPILGVSGEENHKSYLFQVGLLNSISQESASADIIQVQGEQRMISVIGKNIEGPELVSPPNFFDVLLGMDILSIGSLVVQGNGTYSFSY